MIMQCQPSNLQLFWQLMSVQQLARVKIFIQNQTTIILHHSIDFKLMEIKQTLLVTVLLYCIFFSHFGSLTFRALLLFSSLLLLSYCMSQLHHNTAEGTNGAYEQPLSKPTISAVWNWDSGCPQVCIYSFTSVRPVWSIGAKALVMQSHLTK